MFRRKMFSLVVFFFLFPFLEIDLVFTLKKKKCDFRPYIFIASLVCFHFHQILIRMMNRPKSICFFNFVLMFVIKSKSKCSAKKGKTKNCCEFFLQFSLENLEWERKLTIQFGKISVAIFVGKKCVVFSSIKMYGFHFFLLDEMNRFGKSTFFLIV